MDKQTTLQFGGALSEIQKKTLFNALKLLDALPVEYIVVRADGEFHKRGALSLATAEPKKRVFKYPFGEVAKYVDQFLAGIQVGDVAVIPVGPYDLDTIRASATARASKQWGNGSYNSMTNAAGDYEILRVA